MGVHAFALDMMYESLKTAGINSLKGKWMLELGNQVLRNDARKKYSIETAYSKVYFLEQRCNHHSIDWNGLDGAVPLDMTKPIPIEGYINKFDIITDFGCIEHVCGVPNHRHTTEPYRLYHWQAWKNIHDMGRNGCLYIHMLPLVGSVPGHGAFHYSKDFFEKLFQANGYQNLKTIIKSTDPRTRKRDYVWSSYLKVKDEPFKPSAEIFKEWLP
jgi:hypothetical protein